MLPFSTNDAKKVVRKRSKFQKRNQPREDSSSSISSIEEIDKKTVWDMIYEETLMPYLTTSSSSSEGNFNPTKTSKKSSKTNFDRNNENINNFFNKFVPSNSSRTSQSEPDIHAMMLKFPFPLVNKNTNPDCGHSQQSANIVRHECTCKTLDIMSASGSRTLNSEHLPVKFVTVDHFLPQVSQSTNIPTDLNTSNHEQYYSCTSGDSESESDKVTADTRPYSRKPSRISGKNFVILELLHEVENLINDDPSLRQESFHITQVSTSNINIKSTKIKAEEYEEELKPKAKVSKSTSVPIVWPPQSPCLCCTNGVGPASFIFPISQPYYLGHPADNQSFACPESCDSFKDCSSGTTNELPASQTLTNLPCICSNITDVCPRHGPLKMLIKKPNVGVGFSGLTAATKSCDIDSFEKHLDPAPIQHVKFKSDGLDGKNPERISSLELEEYVDEELNPCYVHMTFTEPFGIYTPSPHCLMEYDDEEPSIAGPPSEADSLYEMNRDFEMHQPCQDCLLEYDDEEPSYLDFHVNATAIEEVIVVDDTSIDELNEPVDLNESQVFDKHPGGEDEKLSLSMREEITPAPISAENIIQISETPLSIEQERSIQIMHSKSESDVEIVKSVEPMETITANKSEENIVRYYQEELRVAEEYELPKEKIAESFKRKEQDNGDEDPKNDMTLATLKQSAGEDSCKEMKFFIDSLIMDLDAMDYARRRSELNKNTCKPKFGLCARKSFPVTISEVHGLGINSLYVKWIIHDCCAIAGYEIYTDGYLTNRYYSSRHDAAVITNIDISLPHKIALVAQTSCTNDESIEMICNMIENKKAPNCLLWKTDAEQECNTQPIFWTPSIYLYDPFTCK